MYEGFRSTEAGAPLRMCLTCLGTVDSDLVLLEADRCSRDGCRCRCKEVELGWDTLLREESVCMEIGV